MKEKTKKAYQCHICKHNDADENDVAYCKVGLWYKCGEPDECKRLFEPLE